MSMDKELLKALEQRLLRLEERVAHVETRVGKQQEVEEQGESAVSGSGKMGGIVKYSGEVVMEEGGVSWEIHRPVEGIVQLQEQQAERLAQVLGALANPIRLTILRLLLSGPKSSQGLQEALGVSSPGQLYHHLRELLGAKIIEQQGRSVYTLSIRKIVPLLTLLAIIYELGDMS